MPFKEGNRRGFGVSSILSFSAEILVLVPVDWLLNTINDIEPGYMQMLSQVCLVFLIRTNIFFLFFICLFVLPASSVAGYIQPELKTR